LRTNNDASTSIACVLRTADEAAVLLDDIDILNSTMISADVLKILILVIAAAVFEGTILDASGLFATCMVDVPTHSSTYSFTIAIYSLFACVALIVLVARSGETADADNEQRRSDSNGSIRRSNDAFNNNGSNDDDSNNLWRALGLVGLYVVWWMATFVVVHAIEMTLNDRRCSRHGELNGISNHFAFFVFHSLQLAWFIGYVSKRSVENYFVPQLYVEQFASTSRLRRALVLIYALFVITSLWTLGHTWMGGYHSLRQCLLGSLIAVVSHFLRTCSPLFFFFFFFLEILKSYVCV
jgi:hypothetical protein